MPSELLIASKASVRGGVWGADSVIRVAEVRGLSRKTCQLSWLRFLILTGFFLARLI
jgi:hypothetical protein